MGFPGGSVVKKKKKKKNPPAMQETQETWVWSLGWEDLKCIIWSEVKVLVSQSVSDCNSLDCSPPAQVYGVTKSQTWLSN